MSRTREELRILEEEALKVLKVIEPERFAESKKDKGLRARVDTRTPAEKMSGRIHNDIRCMFYR